jgi:chromosomal replication initiation ATPase DnaA
MRTKRIPRVIMKRQDRIDYVLNGMCRYYNIRMETLLHPARTRVRDKRKRIAIKLLRDIADVSFKEIKYAFGCNSEGGIYQIYSNISDDLSTDVSVTRHIRKEYDNIIEFLGV